MGIISGLLEWKKKRQEEKAAYRRRVDSFLNNLLEVSQNGTVVWKHDFYLGDNLPRRAFCKFEGYSCQLSESEFGGRVLYVSSQDVRDSMRVGSTFYWTIMNLGRDCRHKL